MTSLAVNASDMDIISESAEILQTIDEVGFEVDEAAIFDTSIDFDERKAQDNSVIGDVAQESSTSWLSFGSGDSDSSSCGSSCGGGCGG